MADRANWLEQAEREYAAEVAVAAELRQRGIPAEFWHSGGGIFTVRIEDGPFEWQFGTSDGTWGWDHTAIEDGSCVSGDLGLDAAVPAAAVAAAIVARLASRPEHPDEIARA